MKPFMFERSLSKKDLGDMYEQMFMETMEGIANQLDLSRKQASQHFPNYVDVRVALLNASEFMTGGRPAESAAALRVALERDGVFNDINTLHAAQAGNDAVLVDEAGRVKIAAELLNTGSHVVTTKDNTVFLFLIKPDYLATHKADPVENDIAPVLLDVESLYNMHLIRRLGDEAYRAGTKWLERVAPNLLQLWPEGDQREARSDHIDILKSNQAAAINRAIRFEQLVNACAHAKGENAAQQYVDIFMFEGMAHGKEMDMVTGRLWDVPHLARDKLRQDFVVAQHGQQDVDPVVAKIAKLLNSIVDEDRAAVIELFGKPFDDIIDVGFNPDIARTMSAVDPSFASRSDVKQRMAILAKASRLDTLADVERVVPFLIEHLEERATVMEGHAKLRKALSAVFTGTAGRDDHDYLDRMTNTMNADIMIDVQAYALAQHYVEVVQRLMPEKFPGLAPMRGYATDARLTYLKMLMDARRPSTHMHS